MAYDDNLMTMRMEVNILNREDHRIDWWAQ